MFAGLVLAAVWVFWPAIAGEEARLVGANPDAVVSAWTLDLLASGETWGPWTSRIQPPGGMIAVPAGTVTGALVMAPVWFAGPLRGYCIAAALVLALSGMAVAWLVREASGRWSVGAVAAAALVGQPAVLQLWSDGALEHMAFWHLPAGLAALLRALERNDARWAAAAGALLSLIPIDGPYEASYALVLLPLLAGPALVGAWRREGTRRLLVIVGWAALAAAPVLVASVVLVAAADARQLPQLAADMPPHNGMSPTAWVEFTRSGGWGAGLPPPEGAVVSPLFAVAALALALVGWRRSLPWLGVSLVALALSLGAWPHVADQLAAILGGVGRVLGGAVAAVNGGVQEVFPFRFVRFPRRWTVLAAVALVGAASFGVRRLARTGFAARLKGRLPRPLIRALPAVVGCLVLVAMVHAHGFRRGLPTLALPGLESCAWIADQPGEGAVVVLPSSTHVDGERQASFAGLDSRLAHVDGFWLQLLHGRSQYFSPSTIPTLIPLRPLPGAAGEWTRAAEDVALGREARAPARGPEHLAELGYRWLLVDREVYGEAGIRELEAMLGDAAVSRREFDDGTGVLVYETAKRQAGHAADAPSGQVATIRP